MTRFYCVITFLWMILAGSHAFADAKDRHVVVVVWDGMRPDFVTESNCPTLFHLAAEGVRFANNHPVFISATEVNGSAIATGAYPGDDGLIANVEYRPEINPEKPYHTEEFEAVRKGDEISGGHYLLVNTVAEILRQHGMKTAVAGAKPIALLHDRGERPDGFPSVDLFAGKTLPNNALDSITRVEGEFPKPGGSGPTRNDWTAGALVDVLWSNGVPAFSLLWMNEPDATQHQTGPGSPASLAAIKNVDDNLARVLKALEAKGVRDQTDVILVSDHGFSTIEKIVDVAGDLKAAGFNATREFKAQPTNGDIMVAGDGGSSLIYVTGHDRKVIERAVDFFQHWHHTGVILTRDGMKGTFSFKQLHVDSPHAPDIMISLQWSKEPSATGTPGLLVSDVCGYHPGQGMHGSLSPFDMHNTLVAAGPDFKQGYVDEQPTGNVDVAPTVIRLLGLPRQKSMDGRVLSEALRESGKNPPPVAEKVMETAQDLAKAHWSQYVKYYELDGTIYFSEGSGSLSE